MSFIGNVPAEAYSTVAKDTFSGNGSTTDFTLSLSATTNGVEVFVENVQQEPTTAYTISGTTLSFTAAPTSGTNNIYVIHRGPAVQQVVPPAGVAIDASSVTASGNLSVTGTTTLTDDLAVDTDTLFVDASANRVGIGTATPSTDLEVSGSKIKITNASGGAQFQGSANGGGMYFDSIGSTTDMIFRQTGSFTERMRIDSSGNLKFNSGYGSAATAYGCRAWVNFVGTGTPSIRDSGNVSSITDNNTGDYTINFSTALVDDDYAVSGLGSNENTNGNRGANGFMLYDNANMLAGSCRVQYSYGSSASSDGALFDPDIATLMVVR